MNYENLTDEQKAQFNALMQVGEIQRALSMLRPAAPLTPEQQAEVERKLAKMEKSNKRFSAFVSAAFVLMLGYAIWESWLKQVLP